MAKLPLRNEIEDKYKWDAEDSMFFEGKKEKD